MRKVAIVTDSSAAIPPDVCESLQTQGGFIVVPLTVEIEGIDLRGSSQDEIHQQVRLAQALGTSIRTASPSLGVFTQVYRDLLKQGYERVLSVHLSSELSSTFDVAQTAAREFNQRVYVLDSRTVALGLGWSVVKTYELADHIADDLELAEICREICENIQLYFYIPTLEALRRGGRVNPALARVGQLLQICPVATVEDGKLIYLERPRTVARAQQILASYVKAESDRRVVQGSIAEHPMTPPVRGELVGAHYSSDSKELEEWLDRFEMTNVSLISPLPTVLTAHTGPGALALAIY